MNIQLALDRITLEEAQSIAEKANNYIDIIEVGTSLIKDYGKRSISFIRERFPDKIILADIKTCDEGEYEFISAFEAGADIATVMGNSSLGTIDTCYAVSKKYNKDIMIDLMETSKEKIEQLKKYKDAIFFIHLAKDSKEGNLINIFNSEKLLYKDIKRIAIGGGVNKEILADILIINPDILVVGSAITKSENINLAAYEFSKMLRKEDDIHGSIK